MKIAYYGYCRDCDKWMTLAVQDMGFLPSEPDMQVVCPVDYEHEIQDIEAIEPEGNEYEIDG